jgi:hypothetical protein
MQILIAVIDDLFQFAYTALFGATVVHTDVRVSLALASHEYAPQPTLPTFSSVAQLLDERTKPLEAELSTGSSYFVGEEFVSLFYEPAFGFDSAACVLPYSTTVSVKKLGGRWACVSTEFGEGWILKDSLRENVQDVFPQLQESAVYTHEHRETQKLRLCINDAFSGERSHISLTDTEFVTYRLGERGKRIPWSVERPRVAGTWQRLLRGKVGVHISIAPKEGAIMEYMREDIGHLAYVEAVFPDESITVSSVGLVSGGEYTKSELTHDMWRELHSVFITIT